MHYRSRVIRYPHKVVGDRWRNASMHTMAGGGWLPNIAQKASSAPNLAASDDRHREGNERYSCERVPLCWLRDGL
jgi:hypothetical protein